MNQMKQKFVDSWNELKHLKTIVVVAMFIAIGVILGFMFTVQITDFLKIGFSFIANEMTALLFGPVVGGIMGGITDILKFFSFIANEMTALLFGPVVGGIMGGITDILKFIVKPTGAYFFGFTLNAILGGVIYGAILYHQPISLKRILVSKIIVAIFVNLLLGTYWLTMLYGKGFIALLPARALKQVCSVPIESIIFFVFAETLSKAKVLSAIKAR